MLKKIVVIAISTLFATLALTARPDKNSGHEQTAAHDKNSTVILPTPDHQNSSETDKTKSDADPPPWYAAFKQPDGMLVIVGIVTCFVIGWQSRETRRAACATPKILLPDEPFTLRTLSKRDLGLIRGSEQDKLFVRHELEAYFFGIVFYRDVLGGANAQFHETHWCLQAMSWQREEEISVFNSDIEGYVKHT